MSDSATADLVDRARGALSELDFRLINALQVNPRASWKQVSRVLGVSADTTARRWQRLVAHGQAWVTAHVGDQFTQQGSFAMIWAQCEAGKKMDVARALVQDPRVMSVEVTTGAEDVCATIALPGISEVTSYALQQFDSLEGVRSSDTMLVSRLYKLGSGWRLQSLTRAETARLAPSTPEREAILNGMSEIDTRIWAELCLDGRASFEAIARGVGASPSTVRQRLSRLLSSRTVALRCDVAYSITQWPVNATLRATVPPEHLHATGLAISRLPQVRMCGSVTGRTNLLVTAWLESPEGIHRLETKLAEQVPGFAVAERSIALRMLKRMGRVLNEDGLAVGAVPMHVW